MWRFFLATTAFFLMLWVLVPERPLPFGEEGLLAGDFVAMMGSQKSEIEKINAEIAQLEEMKRGYEARALRHDDMATYLQFDDQAVLETRRHLQLAQENRNKAALVQEQIDRLQEKKRQLQR